MDDMERISPKTAEALPGSLHAEYARCGKAACDCMNGGPPHGPYWRRYWRAGGRTRKAYVRLEDVENTRTAVALWRQHHPSVRSLIRDIRALWRLMEEERDGA